MSANPKSLARDAIRAGYGPLVVLVPIAGYILRDVPGVTAACFAICLLIGLAWRSCLVTCLLIGALLGHLSTPLTGSGLAGSWEHTEAVRVLVGTVAGLLFGCVLDRMATELRRANS